ncbi:Vacuolar protein sorting-associated protein 5 [Podochytrium sp. JEL0797]|nr:Vacuolar protein sorting-associated protein 5 [Podochytrium sp. JEL0797]
MDSDDFGSQVWGDPSAPAPLPTSLPYTTTPSDPLASLSLNDDEPFANDPYTSTSSSHYNDPYHQDPLTSPFAQSEYNPEYNPPTSSQYETNHSQIGEDSGWGNPPPSAFAHPMMAQTRVAPLTAGISVANTITPKPVAFDPLANIAAPEEEEDQEDANANEGNEERIYGFQVTVSEPQEVGNKLMGGHVVYKVSTWTNCPGYTNASFSVSRRYTDFLWVYHQLVERYPGAIVQTLPGKNSLGRFQQDFIETRRAGLEKFLLKTVSHALLQQDADLRLFLESNSFSADKKEKRPTTFLTHTTGLDTTAATYASSAMSGRVVDSYTLDNRRLHIEMSDEMQLKQLLRVLEVLVKQRRDYGNASKEFGDSLGVLAGIEAGKEVGACLGAVAGIQARIQVLHDKQASIDLTNLATTVEDHLALIGAVRVALAGRMKVFMAVQNADIALKRKKESIERMRGDGRGKVDQITLGLNNLPELERQLEAARDEFRKVDDLIHKELDRYDTERVADFSLSVQAVLKCFIETQKEMIRLWESYYEQTGQELPVTPSVTQIQ